MAHIFQMQEWESNGKWLCGDVSALAADSNDWTYPAQILNLSLPNYILLLYYEYNAEIHYSASGNVLVFYFSSLADCRKFKNYINRKAREKHFVTY